MHHSRRVSGSVRRGVLLGLVLACTAGRLAAQVPEAGPSPRPNPNALIIAINATQRVGMPTGKALKQAVNEKENIARVQPIAGDPTRVLITGLEPGITRVSLTDVDGKTEAFDVVVQF